LSLKRSVVGICEANVADESETAPQILVIAPPRGSNKSKQKTGDAPRSKKSDQGHSSSSSSGDKPNRDKNSSSSKNYVSKSHKKIKHTSKRSSDVLKQKSHHQHSAIGDAENYSSTDSEMEVSSNHNRRLSPMAGLGFIEQTQQQLSTETSCVVADRGKVAATLSCNAPSLFQQLQQQDSPPAAHRKQKPIHKSAVRNHLDFSSVAEFDPSFPDLDGHPLEDSLLHDIDEDLIRPQFNLSESDAEMEEEEHTSNNLGRRATTTSPGGSKTGRKRAKRAVDPEKIRKQAVAALATEIRREEKIKDAKVKRDHVVFQRRVLEANNGRNSVATVGPDDQEGDQKSRKRRVTSGLSEAWSEFYGRDIAINQRSQTVHRELILGCADAVLGSTSTVAQNEDDPDYAAVLSYRTKAGAVCDRVLKQKLMKHLQLDIFKEITFERLITEYSVAKRESAGAADDEIVDIDWFQVMGDFSGNLKTRCATFTCQCIDYCLTFLKLLFILG
jgi:hypothetical protein